ncbi:MAG: transposase, partial [Ruminococcus sp.]|nr:transposase [Ruminococcus sp.]
MAFVANNTQRLTLTDSTFNLTEREKRFLEKSWARTLAEKVFPAIDETIFSPLYSDKASLPNTLVNVIVGALILKEALGDTDDELAEALMFDIRYQYALHTTSFEEQPLSDRT